MSLKKNLERLIRIIPPRIPIRYKISYEFLWVDSFVDPRTMGETRYAEKQIVIKRGLSTTETMKTIIHEVAHAIDMENNIGLTETQILKIENAVFSFLKLNKLFGE